MMLFLSQTRTLCTRGSNTAPCSPSRLLAGWCLHPTPGITQRRHASTKNGSLWKHAETAQLIFSAKTTDFPTTTRLPEVVFTGRSNSGKSTLIGAILGRGSLVRTSKKAGNTRGLDFYRVGPEPGDVVLVDTPGYGAIGKSQWGAQFDHYLETREQLKRIYVILNIRNGFNKYDETMLQMLASKMIQDGVQKFTLQSVITKADTLDVDELRPALETIRKQIWQAAPLCLLPIITSATMAPPFGVDKLRQNVIEACGILP